MAFLRNEKGQKLVSPSCASDAAGDAWLAEFMELVGDSLPDCFGLHYYGSEVDRAIDYIESKHRGYSSLPIIVSEIACTSRNKREVSKFTAKLCNWMDVNPWIFIRVCLLWLYAGSCR